MRRASIRRLTAAAAVFAAFTASAATIYGDYTYESNTVLSEDTVVQGALTVPSGVTVDTAGHMLTIRGLGTGGGGTITSSAAGGVLNFDIPAGVTCVNSDLAITGGSKMTVWKTGAGYLQMTKLNTGFGGDGVVSMIVKAGTVKKGADNGGDSPNGDGAAFCGAQYSTIVVEDGGQFDIGGRTYWDYDYEIAGDGPKGAAVKGALINTVRANTNPWHWQNLHGYLRKITLTADASVGAAVQSSNDSSKAAIWGLHFYNGASTEILLNGHTLSIASERVYIAGNRYFDSGTLRVAPGGILNSYGSANTHMAEVVLQIDGVLKFEQPYSPVKSFIFGPDGQPQSDSSTSVQTVVHDTYAPSSKATAAGITHPKVQLGASGYTATTLDLSLFGGQTFAAGAQLSFFAGSAVTVETGKRNDIADGLKLVSWSSAPASGVTFTLHSGIPGIQSLGLQAVAESDGLYLRQTSTPSYAVYSLTGSSWEYFNQDGTAYANWEGGLADGIEIRFSTYEEYQAISALSLGTRAYRLVAGSVPFTVPAGTGLADFTQGIDFTIGSGVTIDVNGNRVRLPAHEAAGALPFTVTSGVAGGVLDLYVGAGDEAILKQVTISGGTNMTVWKSGAGFLDLQKENTGFGGGGAAGGTPTGDTIGATSLIVKEGRVKRTNGKSCGVAYSVIKVEDGAQFDIAGRTFHDYDFDIAGDGPADAPVRGALVNTVVVSDYWNSDTTAWLKNITLSADATIGGSTSWNLGWYKSAASNGGYRLFNLNGHTATFAGSGCIYPNDKYFIGDGNVTVEAGQTFDVWIKDLQAPDAILRIEGIYKTEQSSGATRIVSPVKSLLFSAGASYYQVGSGKTTVVRNTYAPNMNAATGSAAANPIVQLGAEGYTATALDLSQFTNKVFAAGTSLTFYAGSAVTVKTGVRGDLAPGTKLVSWSSAPADTVAFTLQCDGISAEARNLTVVPSVDGLYVKSTLVPAYAIRDVAEGKWNFYNADGSAFAEEWTEITADIEVRFSTFAEYAAIKALGVSPLRFYMTSLSLPQGADFYDMSTGMDFIIDSGLTIDVKGNRLRLPPALVDGSTPFTVTSSVAGGVFDIWVDAGNEITNTQVAITGGANMQVWKTGGGKVVMDKLNTGYGQKGSTSTPGPISTVVKEGFMKKGHDTGSDDPNGANALYCGAAYSIIKIETGGQFDIAGRAAWDYNYDIEGAGPSGAAITGALINTVQPTTNPWHWNGNHGYLYNITLAGDATIGGTVLWALHFYNDLESHVYLNGNTLTIANASNLYISTNKHFDSGKIYIAEGSTLNGYYGVNTHTGNVEFRFDGTYRTETSAFSPVKSLVFGATGMVRADYDKVANRKLTVVRETYAPNLNANYTSESKQKHLQVQLGAEGYTANTLDLRLFGNDVFAAESSLSFYAGSTVTVDLSARTDLKTLARSASPYVVTWDALPAGADTAVFTPDEATAAKGYTLAADATGLKLCPRVGFIIRLAALERDLSIPAAWVATNLGLDFDSADSAVAEAAAAIGANGLPKWQSYCLGLTPADPESVVLCEAAEAAAGAADTVAVKARNLNVPEGLSGVTVKAYLDRKTSNGDWSAPETGTPVVSGSPVLVRDCAAGGVNRFRIRIGIE